jgi:hypothetical protein
MKYARLCRRTFCLCLNLLAQILAKKFTGSTPLNENPKFWILWG